MATAKQNPEALFYLLSPQARCLTYQAWLEMGGCGFANYSGNPMARAKVFMRNREQGTLGEFADSDAYIDRSFARFAVLNLNRPDLAVGPFTAEQLRKHETRTESLPVDEFVPALPPLRVDDLAQERALTTAIFNDPTTRKERTWAQGTLWASDWAADEWADWETVRR